MSCVHVYEELRRQGLDATLDEDQEVSIRPTGQKTTMGEITLGNSSIRFLKDRRNEIVHHYPLFVDVETLEKLPEDIQSTQFLTQEDATKLAYLSHRLHIHSIGIFFKFSVEYMQDIIAEMVSAWYYDC
ncbi:hypothetical protein NDI76_22415 [Halogeometricum sp. S1BR25-6]|uniref:Uncharacterized protein n=1 Tax=Halogeometricum salsisoli TaxID=2950536 RepID=A0ABU2GMG5_9EURY|nr:hypothetical protein [Halogeometricum sp. S1BR25-6]MDS0301483.1 hypothetical protein [Halogeometricum sp. S1BR25-6]